MLMRLVLRALSLGAKFALTLAIAHVLGYAAVAQYGIAVAAAVIGTKMLGLGFSAECNRRLATVPDTAIPESLRLAGIHAACYVALAVAATLLWQQGVRPLPDSSNAVLALAIGAVVMADHQAFEVNGYLFALHRTTAASWLMFVRNGLWPVLALAGLASGVIDDMVPVLLLWIAADLLVIVWGWRLIWRMGNASTRTRTVGKQADNLLQVWRAGSSIYVATILLSATQYAERFIGAEHLHAEALGRYVFLWAIANAVQTLAQAAIATTAGPALSRAAHDTPWNVAALLKRQQLLAVAVALVTAAGLWLSYAAILKLAGGAGAPQDRTVFGILLLSFVLRSMADIEWVAAIALKLRGVTLLGMSLVALAGIPLAWLLIRTGGLAGAALAHGALSVAVVAWLSWTLRQRLAGKGAASSSVAGADLTCR